MGPSAWSLYLGLFLQHLVQASAWMLAGGGFIWGIWKSPVGAWIRRRQQPASFDQDLTHPVLEELEAVRSTLAVLLERTEATDRDSRTLAPSPITPVPDVTPVRHPAS